MKNDIIAEFESVFADHEASIEQFDDNLFNVIPFEGSWSAAQVADHLLQSNNISVNTLTGSAINTERSPDEKENAIRSAMLDFETKTNAPDFVLPAADAINKEEILEAIRTTGSKLRNILLEEDLTKLCTDFPLPVLGELTRYEWLCFTVCHTKRHTRQINDIYNSLKKEH